MATPFIAKQKIRSQLTNPHADGHGQALDDARAVTCPCAEQQDVSQLAFHISMRKCRTETNPPIANWICNGRVRQAIIRRRTNNPANGWVPRRAQPLNALAGIGATFQR